MLTHSVDDSSVQSTHEQIDLDPQQSAQNFDYQYLDQQGIRSNLITLSYLQSFLIELL